jgi:acyl-CoA synthetase (AMP-forming)/AMP-acid ligase II
MLLLDRLARHASVRPDAVAYRDAATGHSLSWRELHNRVSAGADAGALRSPALIRLPNSLQFPVAFLSKLMASRPAFLVSPDEPMGRVPWAAVERTPSVAVGPRLLLLSSGSTGAPKVVCRSAASVDAVCAQMVTAIGITPDDHVLATVPLCHSYGLEHGLLAPVWAGATVTLCRGLDLPVVRRELLASHITVLPGVPSTFEALARLGDAISPVRAAYSAGGPLPPGVADACRERFGLRIGQVYGATEIGSVTYGEDADGSVGRPMPGVTIRTDADGQVMVAAGSLFDGYLGDENPTTADGFYPTGDLGHVDDAGRLHITGRARLLIDVGGRKVNPLEVEGVLLAHPRVGGCVVVPVRQTDTVARLKAVVEPRRPGPAPDPEDLRAFARERLAAHKVPRAFEVRDALPRSPAGKVLRSAVGS